MIRFFGLGRVLALVLFVAGMGSGLAAWGGADAADGDRAGGSGAVYVKMDYMKLSQSTAREYFALELGEWRAIHAERIRMGVTTAWYFYERMPGAMAEGDQAYDYITISVFDDYEKIRSEAGVEAIFRVYPDADLATLYARADRYRDFVRTDIWKLEAVTSPYTDSKPVSPFLTINYMDSRDKSGEHDGLERGAWARIHGERIARDALNSAAYFTLENPAEETRHYTYGTIDYYDHLDQLRIPLDADLITAANPEMTAEDVGPFFEATEGARKVYKSQLWRLIDAIDRDTLED